MSDKLDWRKSGNNQKLRAARYAMARHRRTRLAPNPAKAQAAIAWGSTFAKGERGYSTRGAQGHDSYARRNYTKITLPKLKFLEGDDDGR